MTAQARLLGGRYQVGELLGYGGMAEVHRGRDLRLGRDVAIKMLRVDLARDRTFQERFRREAQNAAALNHPAIVAVYDTGEEFGATGEKLPYIVMEFVNGRTLKEVLASEGRLMPRRALEILADICAALEFSHRHGIIHRDIKPGNVMLNQNGQVKVMDFGIARALASGATTMTQTSAVIGTAQYLSPEQARGESVDARSDVYAAGCVLFELLCGHPPFVGDSPVSVAYQHVREDARPPSQVNREVTPDIDAVVLKALAKNPINRYQSAAEMRADLLRAAAGRPVMATPVMREDETVAMGAGVPTRQIGAPVRPPARVGDARRRRASAWVLAALSALGVLAVVALLAGLWLSNQENSKIEVPLVTGKTVEAAQAQLEQAGLQPKFNEPPTKGEQCAGKVLDQHPSNGTQVAKDSVVSLDYCVAPDQKTVPTNLEGKTRDEAEAILQELGLKPKFEEENGVAKKDTVTRVPDEGKQVNVGTVVVVVLSKGNQAEVPSVVGKSSSAAKQDLEDAGFNVRVVVITNDGTKTPGEVTEQDPAGGQIRTKGSEVKIFVAGDLEEPEPTTPAPTATATATPSA